MKLEHAPFVLRFANRFAINLPGLCSRNSDSGPRRARSLLRPRCFNSVKDNPPATQPAQRHRNVSAVEQPMRAQSNVERETSYRSAKPNSELSRSIVLAARNPVLVRPLPRRPRSLSNSCPGCICPCSGASSAYRVRDPFRTRLRLGQR